MTTLTSKLLFQSSPSYLRGSDEGGGHPLRIELGDQLQVALVFRRDHIERDATRRDIAALLVRDQTACT